MNKRDGLNKQDGCNLSKRELVTHMNRNLERVWLSFKAQKQIFI